MKEIGVLMIEKNSNVPRIVEKLLLKNWVEKTKDTTDTRHSYIQLTQKGRQLIEAVAKDLETTWTLIPQFEEKEMAMLETLLLKFKNNQF